MSTTSFYRDAPAGSLPGFTGVEFSDFGRRLALCRWPCDMPSWRRLDNASALSLGRVLQHADIWSLRSLLAREGAFVLRLDDHRVRTAVAQLVERGVLGLFERDGVAVEAAPVPAGLAPQLHPAEPPSTPSALRMAAARAQPASSASPAPVREDEPALALDPLAQVAALVAAARSGTPFCEECQRRATARKEAVAA